MKNNKKWIIGILSAVCIVLVIGTAVFASGTAKKVFTGSNKASADTEDYIKEEEAKKIALDHAKLTEDEVTFIRIKLDYDDGIAEYEVEFYKDNMEYDYSIDASTGAIRSFDYEAEGNHRPSQEDVSRHSDSTSHTRHTPDDTSSYISESDAVQKALDHAGLTESNVSGLTVKLDYDDGQTEYEVEFFVDRMEYNYEINAVTGEIISYDQEIDD